MKLLVVLIVVINRVLVYAAVCEHPRYMDIIQLRVGSVRFINYMLFEGAEQDELVDGNQRKLK